MTNQLESPNTEANQAKELAQPTPAQAEVFAAYDVQSSITSARSAEPQPGFLWFDDSHLLPAQKLDNDKEHVVMDPTLRESEKLPQLPETLGTTDAETSNNAGRAEKTCLLDGKPPLHSGSLDDVYNSPAQQLKIDELDYVAKVDGLCETSEGNSPISKDGYLTPSPKVDLQHDREHQLSSRQIDNQSRSGSKTLRHSSLEQMHRDLEKFMPNFETLPIQPQMFPSKLSWVIY